MSAQWIAAVCGRFFQRVKSRVTASIAVATALRLLPCQPHPASSLFPVIPHPPSIYAFVYVLNSRSWYYKSRELWDLQY